VKPGVAALVMAATTLAGCATTSPSPTAPAPTARRITADDLAVRATTTMVPPPSLSAEAVAYDLALLKHALKHGYGGYAHIDAATMRTLMDELDGLATRVDPQALCVGIGEALARLPDAHLSARIGGTKCGDGYKAHLREPSVGANRHPAAHPTHWALSATNVSGRRIGTLTITSFPAHDDPSWEGYDDAVEQALTLDALIVDLRGNGGGDDTRGYQLATALLGAEVPPAYRQVFVRQTPEAITLQLNWLALMMLQAARDPDGTPPHVPSYFVELKRTQLEVLEGKTPAEVTKTHAERAAPTALAFDKPIMVLVDSRCGSSCESSAEALRAHPRTRLVGERTAGYIHFGNGGVLVLPGSQVLVYLPTKYNAYADGAFYDKVGFTPDVEVPAGADPHAVALEQLGAR
jgi:hypothetical protein